MSARDGARRADAALLAVSLLWGLSFPAIKMATPFVAPVLFVALRFGLATLLLGLGWRWLGRDPQRPGEPAAAALRDPRWRRAGLGLGLLLAVGYATQTVGLRTTTAGNSAFITALSVVLVPIVAALRLRQRPAGRLLAALLPAVAGLSLLTRPDLGRPVAGDLWTLACAAAYAVYLVELNRALAVAPFPPLLFWQVAGVAFATAAWALAVERGSVTWNGTVALSLLLTTLFSTLGALYLQNRWQGRTTALRAALIFTTEPVFAVGFAALILGERLPAAFPAGAALILAAVLLAELGGRRPRAEEAT